MRTLGSVTLALFAVGTFFVAGCEGPPSVAPTPFSARPSIEIDPSWQASNGEWTFTGHVDPQGAATSVVLEIGPGPITLRQFDRKITVVQGVANPAPLTITTTAIPDIAEICVRFTATNSLGTSSTTPLCFPHDVPSIVVDIEPPVTTFSAPAFGAAVVAINKTSYTVAWKEADNSSSISSRSLQRQVADYSGGACGTFADDGAPSTKASPVSVAGLLDGKCYQWIQTLSDRAGNSSATTSGTIRIALGT